MRGAAAATKIPIGTSRTAPTATTRSWSAPRPPAGPPRCRRLPSPSRRRTPCCVARLRGKLVVISASAVGAITAPLAPCIAVAASNHHWLVANPPSNDAAENMKANPAGVLVLVVRVATLRKVGRGYHRCWPGGSAGVRGIDSSGFRCVGPRLFARRPPLHRWRPVGRSAIPVQRGAAAGWSDSGNRWPRPEPERRSSLRNAELSPRFWSVVIHTPLGDEIPFHASRPQGRALKVGMVGADRVSGHDNVAILLMQER